ncbi:MAG: hypothetical protein KDD58_04725 [Bdellovibrionales bacterium]|nr:hypothetical protein [Bdellovibrionales bacterium]
MKFCFVLFIFLNCQEIWALQTDAVEQNNMGVEQLEAEDPFTAYKHFLEALSKEPFHPAIRLNLGLSFQQSEEFTKAYKESMTAYRYTQDPELKYISLFNAGNAAASAKEIDKALSAYQLALDLKPDSEEVKKNIELLWQSGGGQGEGGQNQKGPQDQQQDQNQGQGEPQKQKPQPKKFDSKQLTKNDVRKILEELKDQEQKIRAKEYEKGAKEAPKEKDW